VTRDDAAALSGAPTSAPESTVLRHLVPYGTLDASGGWQPPVLPHRAAISPLILQREIADTSLVTEYLTSGSRTCVGDAACTWHVDAYHPVGRPRHTHTTRARGTAGPRITRHRPRAPPSAIGHTHHAYPSYMALFIYDGGVSRVTIMVKPCRKAVRGALGGRGASVGRHERRGSVARVVR
jgi:hypothetical protein